MKKLMELIFGKKENKKGMNEKEFITTLKASTKKKENSAENEVTSFLEACKDPNFLNSLEC